MLILMLVWSMITDIFFASLMLQMCLTMHGYHINCAKKMHEKKKRVSVQSLGQGMPWERHAYEKVDSIVILLMLRSSRHRLKYKEAWCTPQQPKFWDEDHCTTSRHVILHTSNIDHLDLCAKHLCSKRLHPCTKEDLESDSPWWGLLSFVRCMLSSESRNGCDRL